MAKRYYLRTPAEVKAGIPPREINEEEIEALLSEEESDDYIDEDVIISQLLLAARNGEKTAKEELKEFFGGDE